MFRHKGKNRTFIHNLRLATLLSFVAGIVNITGVLSFKTLTTNVTGHFAFFAEEVMRKDFAAAITFLVFTLFFLLGAFIANFISEFVAKTNPNLSHIFPISLEILLDCGNGSFEVANLEKKSVRKVSESFAKSAKTTKLYGTISGEMTILKRQVFPPRK